MNKDHIEELVEYPGIGQGVAEALLDQFENLDSIREASTEELESVTNVGPKVAQRIVEGKKEYETPQVDYELPPNVPQEEYRSKVEGKIRMMNSGQLLFNLYSEILDRYELRSHLYQEQISILKHIFRGDVDNQILADAIGCDQNYPSRFKWNEDAHAVFERESSHQARKFQASKKKEKEVLERDHCCVKCGYNPTGLGDCIIHHIIPVVDGGQATKDNLAVLCKECHSKAHEGQGAGKVFYDSPDDFWNWSSPE
jgi:hypothetical protein